MKARLNEPKTSSLVKIARRSLQSVLNASVRRSHHETFTCFIKKKMDFETFSTAQKSRRYLETALRKSRDRETYIND